MKVKCPFWSCSYRCSPPPTYTHTHIHLYCRLTLFGVQMECCTLLRAMQLDADALVFADAYAEALNHLNPLFSWCTTCWPQYKHIFIRTYSVRISYTYTFIVALPLHLDVNPGQKFRDREQVPFLLANGVKRLPFDSKLNMCHA